MRRSERDQGGRVCPALGLGSDTVYLRADQASRLTVGTPTFYPKVGLHGTAGGPISGGEAELNRHWM